MQYAVVEFVDDTDEVAGAYAPFVSHKAASLFGSSECEGDYVVVPFVDANEVDRHDRTMEERHPIDRKAAAQGFTE